MPPGMARHDCIVPPDLDVLVPAQWAATPYRGAPWARLGAAVLREAWQALGRPRAARSRREALAFFFGPADATAPLSFEAACWLAGVEPDDVRRVVRARLEAQR
jgi:hypothetical protein